MNDFAQVLEQMSKIPGALAAVAAVAGLLGSLVTVLVTRFALGPRDRQDREVEWRKHAIELSKLDLDRKIKTRAPEDSNPLRPSILDFLANYRDLQELGTKSPKQLYLDIEEKRIAARTSPGASSTPAKRGPWDHRLVLATALMVGSLLARRWGEPERSRGSSEGA